MRYARVKAEGTGCYHVVSRIVDRNFRLDDGEKELFRRMMRKAEAFSGVRVLTYAILSNHFHLLVEVPVRGEVLKIIANGGYMVKYSGNLRHLFNLYALSKKIRLEV